MARFAKIDRHGCEPRGCIHVFNVRTKSGHLFQGKDGTLLQHLRYFALRTSLET